MTNPAPITATGAVLLAAYALGCLNAGYYLVRLGRGLDVRQTGSGGTGATNVGRLLGTGGFAATLVLDAGKGALAVLLALATARWTETSAETLAWGAAVAAVAGHVWPIQLRFRGGRGIATWTGAVLALDPLLFGLTLGTAAVLFLPMRRMGFGKVGAALTALAASPALAVALGHGTVVSLALLILAAIVALAHRPGLRRTTSPAPSPEEPR